MKKKNKKRIESLDVRLERKLFNKGMMLFVIIGLLFEIIEVSITYILCGINLFIGLIVLGVMSVGTLIMILLLCFTNFGFIVIQKLQDFALCLFSPKDAAGMYFKYYWQPTIVRIEAYGTNDRDGYQGTGVCIDDNGTIITNAHILRDDKTGEVCKKICCSFSWAQIKVDNDAKLIAYNEEDDLAIIKIERKTKAVKKGSAYSLCPGDKVYALGNAGGYGMAISQGIVASSLILHETRNSRLLQMSMSIIKGNSGGPVFDKRGKMVGLETLVNQGFSYAIPIDEIMDFVEKGLLVDVTAKKSQIK